MIIDQLPRLRDKRIILASQSPRRREILNLMGLPFDVQVSSFAEDLPMTDFPNPAAYAVATAKEKALDVHKKLSPNPDLIIASDTIVVLDDKILEKPTSEGDAFRTLKSLSGRRHHVVTAVALVTREGNIKCFHETTSVWFATLPDSAIEAYIKTREPMDKAGSYGIQGWGGAFVQKIEGCYFCVMGLPMHALAREIRQLVESDQL